jgi:hypothetical protein
MIWTGLAVWSIWGAFLCAFYGQRAIVHENALAPASFAILCGPLVWLAMIAVWIFDVLWRH